MSALSAFPGLAHWQSSHAFPIDASTISVDAFRRTTPLFRRNESARPCLEN